MGIHSLMWVYLEGRRILITALKRRIFLAQVCKVLTLRTRCPWRASLEFHQIIEPQVTVCLIEHVCSLVLIRPNSPWTQWTLSLNSLVRALLLKKRKRKICGQRLICLGKPLGCSGSLQVWMCEPRSLETPRTQRFGSSWHGFLN